MDEKRIAYRKCNTSEEIQKARPNASTSEAGLHGCLTYIV